jgi:hypothetical protein
MNVQHPEVGLLRARINSLRWWWLRRMGWAGGAALAALLAALAMAFVVRPQLADSQHALLQAYVARLDQATRLASAASAATSLRDPRDAARDALPALTSRGASIGVLLELLGQTRVLSDRAEYVAEDQEPQLSRLRITLPVRGEYGAVRELIAKLLNQMPNAALDEVQLERVGNAGAEVGGSLRISLFFRREAP